MEEFEEGESVEASVLLLLLQSDCSARQNSTLFYESGAEAKSGLNHNNVSIVNTFLTAVGEKIKEVTLAVFPPPSSSTPFER